jgi:hypothetical protein
MRSHCMSDHNCEQQRVAAVNPKKDYARMGWARRATPPRSLFALHCTSAYTLTWEEIEWITWHR